MIVPAYNEESVVARTISGILASSYRNLEVIVVDDGSHDNTFGVLQSAFGTDPRVALIRIANGGKANALNVGLSRAKGEIIVALDADTQFNRDTIGRLVRWFADETVGAVAGNAKVGNRINMITRWQALEYIVAQNLERRALAALGTLTVVPGAVGAWRRSVLNELGGFRGDTLAEDQELTIAVQQAGYRVVFDSSAIAWTEAPATARALAKQRFRWAYGTLQCLWKYRRMTFNPRYGALGMIALPQVWLFQILLTALAPLADLLLVWQLVWQYIAYLQHGSEFSNADLKTVGSLLRRVRCRRSDGGGVRLPDGAARAMEPVVVADVAALRLPPDHVLRGRALDHHGAQGRGGRLGQARTHRHRDRARGAGSAVRTAIGPVPQLGAILPRMVLLL